MLRKRINLGFFFLLLITLTMGLYSINRCIQLGFHSQKRLQESYQTASFVQQLQRNAFEMNELLIEKASGQVLAPSAEFFEASHRFEETLKKQENTAQTEEERVPTFQLRKLYTEYLKSAWTTLHAKYSQPINPSDSNNNLETESAQMLKCIDSILEAHQEQIKADNSTTRAETTLTIGIFVLLMILACIVTIYLSTHTARWILEPLASLTHSIRKVGEGNLDQQLPTAVLDEFGGLASSFNQMTAQLKDYHQVNLEKILRLDETMRKTLTSFPDPIFVLNAEGTIGFRNPSADRLAVKLLFAGVARLPDRVQKLVSEVLASGKDYLPTSFKESIHFQFNHSDAFFMPRVVLLKDDHEIAFGAAVILEDITRIHLLDTMKSNLVATVSHEIKTPLTGLRMSIYLLHEQSLGALNETQAELVATARESTDRMLTMLNDFLNLTRLEEGVPNLNLQAIPPQELISKSVTEMTPVANLSEIKLLVEDLSGLPSVLAEPQRVVYVFNNLIGNAIKYSPGGQQVRINAERCDENRVRFLVRDHGPGIAQEYHARLFEKFYRVPGSNKNGTGLGLAIAREIVLAHGGEIGVRSKVGDGSEFYVILPTA